MPSLYNSEDVVRVSALDVLSRLMLLLL